MNENTQITNGAPADTSCMCEIEGCPECAGRPARFELAEVLEYDLAVSLCVTETDFNNPANRNHY